MPISLADFTKQNNMTENEMTDLLLKLADLGVTGIKIFYSGSGDSGDIDDVVYTTTKKASFDDIMNLSNYGQENTLYLATLDGYLRDDLIDFANEKILNGIEDWWNNDGGYGVMLIKIPSGEYEINNTIYVTDTEEFKHNGDLISKSLN
jgi:hypothetical protein